MSTMNYIATSDELTSVADAIRTKGGTSSPLVFPAGFVSAIEDIPTGGTTVEPSDVNFFDYDGTLVDSCTAEEFAALSALPANPSHEGLTAQGWNWSLSDAQTYVASYGKLDIGQMYITDDGKTRIHIKLEDGRLAPYLGIAINGSADVDWGDGSTHSTVTGSDLTTVVNTQHTYAAAGEYVIAIDVTGEAALLGNSSKGSYILYSGSSSSSDSNKTYQFTIIKAEIGSNIEIGEQAFAYCYKLSSITIPNGVANIGSYAFRMCNILKAVIIPISVTNISASLFGNSGSQGAPLSLEYVSLPNSVTVIGDGAFYGASSLKSISIPNNVTAIGNNTFNGCNKLESISIPNSVTAIGNSAFNGCNKLESISIPNNVTAIGNSAFSNCYKLKSISIPNGVDTLKNGLFASCYSLEDTTLSDNVKSLGDNVFTNCYSLTSATVPSGVETIGKPFASQYGSGGCYSLAEIIFKPLVPAIPSAANTFQISADCLIIVPFSALAAYLTATYYPAPATYTYMGFATYNSGETLPTQDSTEAYNVTWYASKADAIAQTNPITEGTGSEIYCRYAAV